MHLKRKAAKIDIPIKRKGTKYVVRTLGNAKKGVAVLIAVRDILKLARTAREARAMQSHLKLNGRPVRDLRESIQLFSIFEAGDSYRLTLLPTGKFSFEKAPEKDLRLVKVISKTLVKNNKIQLNLHDGSNMLSGEKISIGDSLYIDFSGKIRKHISLSKGRRAFIIGGAYKGRSCSIIDLSGKVVKVELEGGMTTLKQEHVVALS